MTTNKNEHIDTVLDVKNDLLAVLEGMDYCLDWKEDPSKWSARELVYHSLDTPPGGIHNLAKRIISGEATEYEIWSDMTNLTPERIAYDISQVTSDIEEFASDLIESLGRISDEDLENKKVLMHQMTRGVNEERTLGEVLERSLKVHIREHLNQLQALREALAI